MNRSRKLLNFVIPAVLALSATHAWAGWGGWRVSNESIQEPTSIVEYYGTYFRVQVWSDNSSGWQGAPYARLSRDGGQTWGNPIDLEGKCLGQPTVASSGQTLRFHIFVRGTDGAVYHKSSYGESIRGSWEALGGIITTSPWSRIDRHGMVTVCGRGIDDRVYCNTAN